MPAEPPAAWQAAGPGADGPQRLQLESGQAARLAGPGGPEAGQTWHTNPLRLAERILAEADQQAAATLAAAEQEAAGMKQEAAEIWWQAAEQAAATIEAAEQEAAELRAAVTNMSAELGEVATYVTENLASSHLPAIRTARPAARPAAEPAAEPAAWPGAGPRVRPRTKPGGGQTTKPATRPAAKPATSPAAKPGASPAAKPKRRWLSAMREMATDLVVFPLLGAATFVLLGFFIFMLARS